MIKIIIDGNKIAPFDILYDALKGMLILAGFFLFVIIVLGIILLVCELFKKLFSLIYKKLIHEDQKEV